MCRTRHARWRFVSDGAPRRSRILTARGTLSRRAEAPAGSPKRENVTRLAIEGELLLNADAECATPAGETLRTFSPHHLRPRVVRIPLRIQFVGDLQAATAVSRLNCQTTKQAFR